jgi:hypothetical protein
MKRESNSEIQLKLKENFRVFNLIDPDQIYIGSAYLTSFGFEEGSKLAK